MLWSLLMLWSLMPNSFQTALAGGLWHGRRCRASSTGQTLLHITVPLYVNVACGLPGPITWLGKESTTLVLNQLGRLVGVQSPSLQVTFGAAALGTAPQA